MTRALSARSKLVAIPGVNIQWPWSERLLSGAKTIETRSYPLPAHLMNRPLALIETPGPHGRKHNIATARIVGTITFRACILYETYAQWLADAPHHGVDSADRQFGYKRGIPKWGWVVSRVERFAEPVSAPKRRGIIFTKNCDVPAEVVPPAERAPRT